MNKIAVFAGVATTLMLASLWLNVMLYTGKLIRPDSVADLVTSVQIANQGEKK